ncbi:hypothetical protein ZWY2020_016227 [Hordeum vulgare]|nr:hypothetical protein ZWY2020_016227 [Hordeum vulgare]
MAPATVVAAAASIQVGHSRPIHPSTQPSQLLLLTPYPPVDPAHQSPPAWTAGPARQRPVLPSPCPPSAVNPVHAVAPPRSFHLFFLDPSLRPNSQSLLHHHPLPRRRAFAGSGDGRFSARACGRALAVPPNLRRAAAPPAPQARARARARSRFSC